MGTQIDSSISLKKETEFGTAVVPDVAYEFTAEDLNHVPTYTQGVGTRAGSRVAAAAARVKTKEEVSGSFTTELVTKGLGKLLEAAFGVGTSTLIAGTAYQQLFTPLVDDYLPSYTIQKSIPLAGGAVQPHTFAGMVCSGFELAAPNVGIPTLKFNWVGKSLDTVAAFAALTYPAGVELLSFINGSLRIGGSVTVPTTTALASGGTEAANVRDFNLTYDNGLDTEGFNFGANGFRARKPVVGLRAITGTLTAEYDSNVLRDAYLNQSDLALVLQFASTNAISGENYPVLEITIPNIRLDGEIPKAVESGMHTLAIPFTGLDGRVAAHPIYAAIVTSETAI